MTAIVLAGQRDGEDALSLHTGDACKALIEIDDTPMLSRVLEALASSAHVGAIHLSGPAHEMLADQRLHADLFCEC